MRINACYKSLPIYSKYQQVDDIMEYLNRNEGRGVERVISMDV